MEEVIDVESEPVEEVVVVEPKKFKRGLPFWLSCFVWAIIGFVVGYVVGLNFPV